MRNKKQPQPQPSAEQVAMEQHVEAMMNPQPALPAEPVVAPLDIFQGLAADRVPLGPMRSAPEVPGKAEKSLFKSVDELQRSESKPVTVSVTPKLKQPLGSPVVPTTAPIPATFDEAAATLIVQPKASSLGSMPVADGEVRGAVSIDQLARRDEYNDASTDSAIADIMAREGDDLLAAEDNVRAQRVGPLVKKPTNNRFQKLRRAVTSRWMLITIPIILIILAAVPYTRYKLAGLVIQKTLAVTVVDSKTAKPVSGASVDYNGVSTHTNAAGQVQLKAPVGKGQLVITKGYYQSYSRPNMLSFSAAAPLTVSLVATGRQVPLIIRNKVTNKPLSGVMVKVLGTSAVSDSAGRVTIVLPTKTTTANATLSAIGYNNLTTTVQITDSLVAANKISLTPAGTIYFLSNTSGKIDLVKANLDGSGRATVMAGTGQEDAKNTSLTASRDWHYVVLRSRRDGVQTGLYLIDTSNGKVTQFDTAAASYMPIGWSGHSFVYDQVRTATAQSQSGRESLKSYDADQQQLNQLDQSQATGSSTSYAFQSFSNFYLIDSQLVYNTQWMTYSSSGTAYDLSSQNDSIRSVGVNGQAKKDLQPYSAVNVAYVQTARVLPDTIDYGVYSNSGDSKVTFYAYVNGAVTGDDSVTATTFAKTYPAYLASPDNLKNFWNDLRSGRQTLLLGDKNANAPVILTSGGEYTAYGWYTSQYLLLSRAGSGLYVIPAGGIAAGSSPLKIGDYYQAPQTATSYGDGF